MARGLLATFPDLGMQVDEVYWMGNEAEGFRVSVRWSAQGTHRGYALYGNPTGRRVHLWGINQLYITGGQITEDWMMFNEFDVHGPDPSATSPPPCSADLAVRPDRVLRARPGGGRPRAQPRAGRGRNPTRPRPARGDRAAGAGHVRLLL